MSESISVQNTTLVSIAAGPVPRDVLSSKEARESRRELHQKAARSAKLSRSWRWHTTAARIDRAVLKRAASNGKLVPFLEKRAAEREAEAKRLLAEMHVHNTGDFAYCHRCWTAIAAFIAGRPYKSVEPLPKSGERRAPGLSPLDLARTMLEVAKDPAVRVDRKAPAAKPEPAQAALLWALEAQVRAWLSA